MIEIKDQEKRWHATVVYIEKQYLKQFLKQNLMIS